MLTGPLPTAERTQDAAAAQAAEDPVPTTPVPHRPAPRLPASCAIAPLALLPAEPPLDAPLSLLYLAISLGGALLAAIGAIAAASLLGYSRSLLANQIAEELADEEAAAHDRLHAEIARYDTEYLAVAFAFTVAGWIIGLWALRLAITPDYYLTALVAFGAVMLFVAGSLPVALSNSRAEATLLQVRPIIRFGWLLLRWPLVLPLMQLTRLSLWVLRIKTRPTDTAEVQKQVLAAVADSAAAALEGEERTWIENIIGLKDHQVATVMTPRPDIIAFAEDTPLSAALETALEHGFSRYPIYREKIDEIVGMLYVKDALRVMHGDPEALTRSTVKSMMRDTLFVSETMAADQLLHRFQAGNQHMAIVLDEYGTTAGIVSVEDVLEEIVGDIADEYDEEPGDEPDEEQVTVVETGRIVEVPARATVEDVNALLGCNLSEAGDWETIAGLVIAHSSRIPRTDETVVIDGVEFLILAADERRLKRLRATLLETQPADETS